MNQLNLITPNPQDKTYIFHEDPSHGWVAVPIAELIDLGIAHQISSYSYMFGSMAYLEEDCDASLFWEARKATGGRTCFDHKITDRDSVIRSYRSYTPPKQLQTA